MKPPVEELAELITDLRGHVAKCVKYSHERVNLRKMIERLDQIQKRLEAGQTRAKVLIAVYPDGSKEGAVALAGTVPVMVVIVDHRLQSEHQFRIEEVPAMAIPTEFIEAVSDEAAEYLNR